LNGPVRICLMIEGQEGVEWEQWLALAHAAEEAGLEGLFRSDHYLSVVGRRERSSLDAIATLAALAVSTERIRLGTLVSPVTFRHPGNVAKMVSSLDEMSDGRIELGLGAGWNPEEHQRHAFAFPEIRTRREMLEEQLQVIAGLWSCTPGWSFEGRHYQVTDARYGPPPTQRPRPPLITGTQGQPVGVRIAARYADHLNLYHVTPEQTREAFTLLDRVCAEIGRDPASITRSVLVGTVLGEDRREAERRLDENMATFEFAGSRDDWYRENGSSWLLGTPDAARALAQAYEDAGAQMLVFQDFLPEDDAFIDLLGATAVDWGGTP
jgi:F420-dependent oxidoreductase-like protein